MWTLTSEGMRGGRMGKVVAVALACALLCGCAGEEGVEREHYDTTDDGRFLCESWDDNWSVGTDNPWQFGTVVDTSTGVTYLVYTNGWGKTTTGGITVLLNSDGSPVISEDVVE